MSIVTCSRCGEQYLNPATPSCVECGAPLIGVDLPPEDEEVGYDLDDWDDPQRVALVERLAAADVPHRWEDLELVVREVDAEAVEVIIDDIDNPDALPVDAGPVDEVDGGELLSMLYLASDVLQHHPTNSQAVVDLLEAVEALPPVPPYGLDPEMWRELVSRASALGDLLGEEASDNDVMDGARDLRAVVRPLV
jgi:hypothetical protein